MVRKVARLSGVIVVMAVVFALVACGGASGGGSSPASASESVLASAKNLVEGLIPEFATVQVRLEGMPEQDMTQLAQFQADRASIESTLAKWEKVQPVSDRTRVMLADWVQFLRTIDAEYEAIEASIEDGGRPTGWSVTTLLLRDMDQVGKATGMDVAAELEKAKSKAAASTTTTATTPDDGASGGAYEQW